MPAVWGRLRAVSSSERLQLPLNKRPRREDHRRAPSQLQQELGGNEDNDSPENTYWHNSFESRLNALGITATDGGLKVAGRGQEKSDLYPYRYEIQKGRTVPRYGDAKEPPKLERSPPITSIEDDVNSSPVFAPPPRNPLRRLQSDPSWRPTSSIYDTDIAAATPSAVPSPLQVTSSKMDPRAVALQISPPSSPDINSPIRKPSPEDVSPMDDDFDMAQQEMIRGPRPAHQPQPQQRQRQQPQQQTTASKAQASPPRSNIPTMRRDKRRQQEAALASRREPRPRDGGAPAVQPVPSTRSPQGVIPQGDAMRWHSDHNDPTFVSSSPNQSPVGPLPLGSTTTISGPARPQRNQHSPSFGERVRHFGIGKSKPEPLDSRPAWNGASGRTALVQPVRDNPNAMPLQAPPKNAIAKRAGRGRGGVPTNGPTTTPGPSETTDNPATSAHHLMKAAQQQQQQPPPPPYVGQRNETSMDEARGAHSYPSPPHSGSPMRMSPETVQPSEPLTAASPDSAAQLPVPPIVIPHADKAIKRKPPPAHSNQTHAARNSLSSKPRPVLPGAASKDDDGWVQPPSRFSISTRATSYTASPRPSEDGDRPPMPEPTAQVSSVMDRSRPRHADEEPDSASSEPIVISVKPFAEFARKGKQSTARRDSDLQSMSRRDSDMQAPQRRKTDSFDAGDNRRSSVMSLSKALPPAPPELLSVHDRVGNLNARLDNLAHRRNNINRSIKQMTELMPIDNLLASAEVMRKREIERRKVEGLKQELADVQQEEYELGLKLHRAYKRLDRDAEFEPTGLWVKRVTG